MKTAEQILDEVIPYEGNYRHYDEDDVIKAMELYAEERVKNLNIPDVSVSLSGFMDWLWLNHNILTDANKNEIALQQYLATL